MATEKEVSYLSEKELYEEILKRIHDSRPASCSRMSEHLNQIGISGSNYHLIKRFVDDKKLYPDRNKPMKEEKLKELISKLGITLIETAYCVEI